MKKAAEIKLDEDATYVVKKGVLKEVPRPTSGFGEQLVIWQNGKIHVEKVSYTVK